MLTRLEVVKQWKQQQQGTKRQSKAMNDNRGEGGWILDTCLKELCENLIAASKSGVSFSNNTLIRFAFCRHGGSVGATTLPSQTATKVVVSANNCSAFIWGITTQSRIDYPYHVCGASLR